MQGAYVTGVRVLVSREYMAAGKTTIEDVFYYTAENQISLACTGCTYFLVYFGPDVLSFPEPLTGYIDSPCQGA